MTFGVRKYAVRLIESQSQDSTQFQKYFACLHQIRALKNFIIPNIIKKSQSVDFQNSGNIAAKKLYDRLKTGLAALLPSHFKVFKERLRRNTFFEVYDLIRNQWIRNGWLEQILEHLLTQPYDYLVKFLNNSLDVRSRHELLRTLKHRYSKKKAGFSIGYLNNLLSELRNHVIQHPDFHGLLWQTMQVIQSDPHIQAQIVQAMQNGWIRQRKRQCIELKPIEILPSLFKSYKLISAHQVRRKFQSNPQVVQLRANHIASLEILQLKFEDLCKEAFQNEMAGWTLQTCVTRIIKPKYSRIQISGFTRDTFHLYLTRKLQYHVRSILAGSSKASILHYVIQNTQRSNFHKNFEPLFSQIKENLIHSINIPHVHSVTWCLKFCEQIYEVRDTSSTDESVMLIFKPYLKHPGFECTVSNQTIRRLRRVAGNDDLLLQLFKTVPIIQLEGRKIIVNQPINMVPQNISSLDITESHVISNVIRGMGVDLGLKHFAVLSIFEYDPSTGIKKEIGRHFLDQRRILGCQLDTINKRFTPPYRHDYNIKRRLEHLREQQRALGSIWRQMEHDGGKNRTKVYYHKKKSYEKVWKKIRNIHATLTQQISHTIIAIADMYAVSWIYFEDLRWSQHSARNRVGRWLSHNQMHFFHSQIIEIVQFQATFRQFGVKTVNARWSSQIAWTVQLAKDFKITYRTDRSKIAPFLGKRTQKQFEYASQIPGLGWSGDSDLNAARNLALRGLLTC